MVLGLSSCYFFFYQLFPLSFFPGSISIRINILWAQLLLNFSTDHLETMHTFSTWPEHVHVVFGVILPLSFSCFCTFST